MKIEYEIKKIKSTVPVADGERKPSPQNEVHTSCPREKCISLKNLHGS